MSSERGNSSRTRSQKHQNKTKFKNDKYDTSHTTKFINTLVIDGVCIRCKDIIDWKIKYKKYKPLKAPSTCVMCHMKNVKNSYHTLCKDCSVKHKLCPKCGKGEELTVAENSFDSEKFLRNGDVRDILKCMPERRRRTFHRFLKNGAKGLSEEEVLEKLNELSMDGDACKDVSELNSDDDDDDDESDYLKD